MNSRGLTETPEQLQEMIDLLGVIKTKHFNVIYESMGMWAENRDEYPLDTTTEWKEMARYYQAQGYISWMKERFK